MYLGSALVANRNGRALISVINTSEIDQEIEIPMIQFEEVEIVSDGRSSNMLLFRRMYFDLKAQRTEQRKKMATFQVVSRKLSLERQKK